MTKRRRGGEKEEEEEEDVCRGSCIVFQDCFSNFFNDINGARALDSCEDNDGHFVGRNWMVVIREK